MLTKIFAHPDTTICGFSFTSDIAELKKECPHLHFYENITNFLELQDLYKEVRPDYKEYGGLGLKDVVEYCLKFKLCKVEQMSNWELRPLR